MMNCFNGILLACLIFSSCRNIQGQHHPKLIGGPCEGCEAIFEFGDKKLESTDTLPDFYEEGLKIKIEGTVFKEDGITPAENVIIYVYHTDQKGLYPSKKESQGWEKRHGYIRGWLKTDKKGYYSFYTLKPAPYPSRSEPAHIHYTIMEPNGLYYWIEISLFENDPLIEDNKNSQKLPRGGGTDQLSLIKEGDLMVGTRNITLGKNIPGYYK